MRLDGSFSLMELKAKRKNLAGTTMPIKSRLRKRAGYITPVQDVVIHTEF
jgi:hypothetical protein